MNSSLFILAGAPGSGKSWVCAQLGPRVCYVSHDKTPRRLLHDAIAAGLSSGLPVVYDPTIKVSTTLKAYPDATLVVIVESEAVVRARLEARGGVFTATIPRRVARMNSLAKRAVFSGTSSQVLDWFTQRLASAPSAPSGQPSGGCSQPGIQ